MKQDCLFLKGLPASGKTTFAREWVQQDTQNRIRINMDDLRHMAGDYKDMIRESFIFKGNDVLVRKALELGKSVVVDNTNFRVDIDWWKEEFPYVNFQVLEMETTIEECIERDSKRENPVSKEVIISMAERYGLIKE